MTERLKIPGSSQGRQQSRRLFLGPGSLVVIAGALLVALLKLVDWAAELLWFQSLGYAEVFWRLRFARLAMFAGAFVPVFLYVLVNLLVLARLADLGNLLRSSRAAAWQGRASPVGSMPAQPPAPSAVALFVLAPAAVATVFGFTFYGEWDRFLRLVWSQDFGVADPIFGRDVGFYVFVLPFLNLVRDSLVLLTALGSLIIAFVYLHTGDLQISGRGQVSANPKVMRHLVANAVLLLAAWAWGLYLDRFDLLSQSSGMVFGAGYTDVHVVLPALWVSLGATLTLIAVFLWVAVRGPVQFAVLSSASYLIIVIVALVAIPWGFQRFTVEPNELALETPYLSNNIAATRAAYGLDKVEERTHTVEVKLQPDQLRANQATIDNIRIWDHRPLGQTFRQLQQIRTYYSFGDVNVDRYWIDGSYRQIMLAARELSPDLPGKGDSWVNRHLQYTHGYGLAMCLAAEKDDEGGPVFVVSDLPPRSRPSLAISRPEIYYGAEMDGYQIAPTGVKEFDYPKGDQNAYAGYAGHGGVLLDRYWKKALFAIQQFDMSIVLSAYVTPESRIQFWRPVQQLVARTAPFLALDRDPYPVIDQGRLYWIQDAYALADGFPYSEPTEEGFSYIRNSVKVVVDAYDGDVRFYVIDSEDPVLRAYRVALPSLFRSLDQMPPGLIRHLRYPRDLFDVQVGKLDIYHMTVPQVFYNREDVWVAPKERFGGETIQMEPYYVLMKLPGEDRLQFLLMTPVTPRNRDNMIAWIAARSDFPGYGEMLVYKLSKDSLVMGPLQVEATIDQDTTISRQLTLWDQRGSHVTRGNLLVIPIEKSFLYVEPVFLLAAGTNIPQLKRVIVGDGARLAMEPTLSDALQVVFGQRPAASEGVTDVSKAVLPGASEAMSRADRALRQGDWTAFGREWETLRSLLEK